MQFFQMATIVNRLLLYALFQWCAQGLAQPLVHIIPEPDTVLPGRGEFVLNSNVVVFADKTDTALQHIAAYLTEHVSAISKIRLRESSTPPGNGIRSISIALQPGNSALGPEAYQLEITPTNIRIVSTSGAGAFYACQSLLQMISAAVSGGAMAPVTTLSLKAVTIKDAPRFNYRGMHLDVSRHFFPISFIKRYIDLLARYKLNVFHWHITDSHGWRLEIKKFPLLTKVGAWRADRQGIPMTIAKPTREGEAASYGGYYTHEDVRYIIAYAQQRYITVIPEIEMPGHCTAALVAYPQYTCLNNPVPLRMPTGYEGDLMHNFCPGSDSTFNFLFGVLDEVIDLFPSEYLHIGGDEVKGFSWLSCPRCQARMQQLGIKTVRELQAYFTFRIDSFVNARGRKSIGWDEILEAGELSKNAAVMSWRGTAGGVEAARKGHRVVMTPYRYTYFDFYQSAPALEPDITYAGLFLDSVYAFNPVAELSESAARNVMGVQACLWTENVETTQRAEYMLLPRLLALAEVAWSSPAKKDYRHFIDKVESEFRYLTKQNVNYSKSLYNVNILPYYDSIRNRPFVLLTDQVAGKYAIRYTVAHETKSRKFKAFQGRLYIDSTTTLTAALFDNQKKKGLDNVERFIIHRALGNSANVITKSGSYQNLNMQKLTDGIPGTIEPYDSRWVRFDDSAFSVNIDLGQITMVDSITFRLLEDQVGKAYLPASINVAISNDGTNFRAIRTLDSGSFNSSPLRQIVDVHTGVGNKTRYIRVSFSQLPAHDGVSFVFLDEIAIE